MDPGSGAGVTVGGQGGNVCNPFLSIRYGGISQ